MNASRWRVLLIATVLGPAAAARAASPNPPYPARGGGSPFQVSPIAAACIPPTILDQPRTQTAGPGQQATFRCGAGGTPPLAFQWQRNRADIPGATSAELRVEVGAADGGAAYRCMVRNACGVASSDEALLIVPAGQPPSATITQPAQTTLYTAGTTVDFAGTASDAEDGTLPASGFTWEVVFHHDDHTHPHVPPISGIRSGSFEIPDRGETSPHVSYRIHLAVRDSSGLEHHVNRELLPRRSTFTLGSEPAGLRLTLDGQPLASPRQVLGVVGMIRSIGAISPQVASGVSYRFRQWSDGGSAEHEITTPPQDAAYTAVFEPEGAGCVTAAAGDGWHNSVMDARTGSFNVEFDATPSASPIDSVIALSQGEQDSYDGFAVLVRFNPSGRIDARNGSAYQAAATIPYGAGTRYRFRVAVNVATRRYSVFVRAEDGPERTVAVNHAFRTQQAGVTRLDWWGVYSNPGRAGSNTVCSFKAVLPSR